MLIKNFDELLSHSPEKTADARKGALSIIEKVLEEMDACRVTELSMKKEGNVLAIKGKKIDMSRFERIYVVGFGKASTGMAIAVEKILDVDEGAVISTSSTHSDGRKPSKIRVFRGSHPLPSEENIRATDELIKIVRNAGENDIEWGDKEWGGNSAWQDATCNKCGCEFQEVYEYKFTEIKE